MWLLCCNYSVKVFESLGYQSHLVFWAWIKGPFLCKLQLSLTVTETAEVKLKRLQRRARSQSRLGVGPVSMILCLKFWLYSSHIVRICVKLNSKVVDKFVWQRKFQDSVALTLLQSHHWSQEYRSTKRKHKLGRRSIKMYSLERKIILGNLSSWSSLVLKKLQF